MANIPTEGYASDSKLDGNSTREQVRTAKIPEGRFGLLSPTKVVPDEGLPMTGSLTDQPVIGDAPVLRIGTLTNIATVQLTRAVSKVRFIFANTKSTSDTPAPPLQIKGITMDADKIPQQEYLIARTSSTLAYYTDDEKPLFPQRKKLSMSLRQRQKTPLVLSLADRRHRSMRTCSMSISTKVLRS